MIGRVHKRGKNLVGLLRYLYCPGRANEHVNPRIVGGWRSPQVLEPPVLPTGGRDFRYLAGLMELPMLMEGDPPRSGHVYHLSIRAAPSDPVLSDQTWAQIAAEVMDRTGMSPRGREEDGTPWVAVRHGPDHVHVVAVLARFDGRPGAPRNDFYRIGEALRDIEKRHGLVITAPRDRTAPKAPTYAERAKARAAGREEEPRVTLRRMASASVAAAGSEEEFLEGLRKRGARVRLRRNPLTGRIDGYAVGLPGDTGSRGQVWISGRHLAPDLSLLKLRPRWPAPRQDPGPAGPQAPAPALRPGTAGTRPGAPRPAGLQAPSPGAGPAPRPRVTGEGMRDGPARAALRRETARAAEARSEKRFFAALEERGLRVRVRHGTRPGRPLGYSVTLPGLRHHADGRPVWYKGSTLAPELSLAALRRRWDAGRPGVPPGFDVVLGGDTGQILSYAAGIAGTAARRIRAGQGNEAADAAYAAADLAYAAADATGIPELREAADGLSRAGRAAWGRVPDPTGTGLMLRTAAGLVSGCPQQRARATGAALVIALARLGGQVARLREEQGRLHQAIAARDAARRLEAAGRAEAAAGLAAAGVAYPSGGAPALVPQAGQAPAAGPRPRDGKTARASPIRRRPG